MVYCAWCVRVWGGGGYFNDSWVGMYHWYPETLSSAEFCYPILVQTPKISPYPRFAIFQKLTRSTLSLILSRVTGKSILFFERQIPVSLV